jgi:cystathionine beta-lyase
VVDEVHAEHILKGTFVSCLTSGCAALDNLIVLTSPTKPSTWAG